MMKNALLIAVLGLLLPDAVFAEKCRFEVDPASIEVGWTAFKTTQKVAVKGSFARADAKVRKPSGSSIPGLLKGSTARIELRDEKSSQSGNPARDQTLYQHFFSHLSSRGGIEGRVLAVRGDKDAGDLEMDLRLSGKQGRVAMKYTRSPEGILSAKGTIDLLAFGAKNAFDDIHSACENLHKGADGVSKTWSEVDIEITAKISGGCAG
jgi:polyisoprenoid-binding protein YceI